MKKLLSFVLLLVAFVVVAPNAFAEDATGGSAGGSASGGSAATQTTGTATVTGTSVTGEPVRMEVEVETEGGVQVITIKPEGSDDSSSASPVCGGKPMPKLECPSGYAVGCNTASQWACVKSAASAQTGVSTGAGAAAGAASVNYLDQDDDGDSIDTILEDDAFKGSIFIKFDDIDGESSEGKANGNVEYDWKVEEGEKFQTGDKPTQADFSIMIDSVIVRGWDPKKKEEVAKATPKLAEAVLDETDLALFVAAHAQNDERLEQISLNFEKITMKYSADGKLIGFIPMKFTEEVTLENGVVKVKFPWYSFLLSGGVSLDDIQAAAQMQKDKHKNEIEILSWSFGASNAGSMSSGSGGGAGKVNVAAGDVNGDGRADVALADIAAKVSALSEVMKASWDLAVQKK